MTTIDRRSLLASTGVALATLGSAHAAEPAKAADHKAADSKAAAPSAPPPHVTQILAHYIVNATYADLPANVRKEGTRTLLNWVGVAIGGSHHETVDIAASALGPFAGAKQAGLFGRKERFDVMNAAFLNGVASHIFDYDDTHLKTIIHPAGPVASAILAYAEYQAGLGGDVKPINGEEFLNALVLGVETECRIGNSVYPNHYDVGWHITGTAGVFGAAAAVSKLMKLNEQQTIYALGLAASQPVGLRESFGSMNKSFNPGRAAANGLFAAILAQKGYTSSDGMIEAKRGWANTISTKQDYAEITEGLGKRYEAALNTYKPFACGIVLHPIIDAAVQLRNEDKITADQIERIDMQVHPLVLELTGKKTPQLGLEGKFSVYHAVAVAIVEGAGGEKQFSDRAVTDPVIVALRGRVFPVVTAGIKPEQVDLTITLNDGRKLHKHIDHAIGSLERPMSDADLERKFTDLAEGIIPAPQIRKVMDLCWGVEKLDNVAEIVQAGVAA
jgi:2-methylcitrate dehydratase PrpD